MVRATFNIYSGESFQMDAFECFSRFFLRNRALWNVHILCFFGNLQPNVFLSDIKVQLKDINDSDYPFTIELVSSQFKRNP